MCFMPLKNKTHAEALSEYEKERSEWDAGIYPEWTSEESKKLSYDEYDGGPPDPDYYRPAYATEPTHYQVYETVSEGTPVTPVFATPEALIDYLAEHGTFWDQRSSFGPARGGWGRENAEAFVRGGGWMPTIVIRGNRMLEEKEILP